MKKLLLTGQIIEELVVEENSIGIFWIGHSSFIFKTSTGEIIFVDPYLSNSVEKHEGRKRLRAIPIKPENVVANLVLCTHDHLDHTDPETLMKIANGCNAKFVGPSSSYRHMRNLGMDKNKLIQINQGRTRVIEKIKVKAVYAKHTLDSIGYVLSFNSISVYVTGDTEYDRKLIEVKIYKPDIMIVCINGDGNNGNMNIEEAIELTALIRPKIVIPMHYGMFKENTADPQKFARLLKKCNLTSRGIILDYAKPFIYKSSLASNQ